jgi:hypothetical protein
VCLEALRCAYWYLEAMTQRYTGLWSTKGIIYCLDIIGGQVHPSHMFGQILIAKRACDYLNTRTSDTYSKTTVKEEQVVHKPDATMTRRIAVTTRSRSQDLQVLSKCGIRVD